MPPSPHLGGVGHRVAQAVEGAGEGGLGHGEPALAGAGEEIGHVGVEPGVALTRPTDQRPKSPAEAFWRASTRSMAWRTRSSGFSSRPSASSPDLPNPG